MPRIRSIKPDFYSDPDLGRLSLEARYLYQSLWVFADDHGRLAGDSRLIKSQTFPFDDKISAKKVKSLLDELEGAGKVMRYEHDGIAYVYLPNFNKHQKIDRPQAAKFPEPPRIDGESESNVREPLDEHSPNEQRTDAEDSSLDRIGKEGIGKNLDSTSPARAPNRAAVIASQHLEKLQPKLASGTGYDLLHEFKEIWPAAWDAAVQQNVNPKAVGTQLVGQFIATVTDTEPDYGRAGQLVGRYGKLALLGIDEGIMANATDPYRYANRVCQNQASSHRAEASR